MSDLAKKCADRLRRKAVFAAALSPFGADGASAKEPAALAAVIEAAQALRGAVPDYSSRSKNYDAALRDLAQSMEVE